jgi:oligoribonuclease NrnB/cAMP/cGMP phosphodiesterase (DHH superfamily)
LPETLNGGDVYIVDFSFSKDEMIELANRMNSVTVLDHHKTAKANLEPLIGQNSNLNIHFDMNVCGAVLTWEFFNRGIEMPILYDYVMDRDCWLWKLPHSREVSAWLYQQPKEFDYYRKVVMATTVEEMVESGTVILQTQEFMVNQILRNSFIEKIAGYYIGVVNSSILQSELGEALCKKYPEHPFVGVFNFPKNLKVINWSLRSDQYNPLAVDVSEIAKSFGGGGHKHAAGFSINL